MIRVNDNIIWDRRMDETKGFPEAKILKQLIRDIIDPQLSLGHSDKKKDDVITFYNENDSGLTEG